MKTEELIEGLYGVLYNAKRVNGLEDELIMTIDEKMALVKENEKLKARVRDLEIEVDSEVALAEHFNGGEKLITPLGDFEYMTPGNLRMQEELDIFLEKLKNL